TRHLRSPHVGEDFPADALLARLAVREEARGGGQDRHAQSAENRGDLGRACVDAQTRLRDALDAGDRALAVRPVLQVDRERLTDARVLDLPRGDVALALEDLGDVGLELAARERNRVVVRPVRVTQTGQHVCDRICHRHFLGSYSVWFRSRYTDIRPSWVLDELRPAAAAHSAMRLLIRLEREAEGTQQGATLLIRLGGGHDRDVEAANAVDLVLVDLVEDRLLGDTEGVVTVAVELVRVEAAEVADARERERQQAVEELPGTVTTEGDVRADRHA